MDSKNLETRVAYMEKDIKAIKAALGISDDTSTEPVNAVPDRAHYDNWVKAEITRVMRHIGVPAHLKGYEHVRQAIILCVKTPTMLEYVTGELYPAVADILGTTPSRVERAIRHAIESAWNRGDLDVFDHYFGGTIDPDKGKPTNSQFIATMVDYIIMKGANNEMG